MNKYFDWAIVSLFCFSLFISVPAQASPHRIMPRMHKRISIVPRRPIDASKLGVNAFANEPRFGTVRAQFSEVKQTLRLNYIRVLFNWNDAIQPSPKSPINFSFPDEIMRSIPSGADALVVVNGLPSWMYNPANWIGGNPRKTFAELCLRKVVKRYGRQKRIVGFEIWNEPNASTDPENILMGFVQEPANYVELAAYANNIVRTLARGKKIVGAATTAINQNYPKTLNYNKNLEKAGLDKLVDIWAMHYYGQNYENIIRPGGIADFARKVDVPIWITEIGAQGVTKQLAYMERTLPFLMSWVGNIQRAYYYQFAETEPADQTYGLRNLTPGWFLSDLYIWLRDRK